jgi:hypothetical protein
MPNLHEPWKRPRRPGARDADAARHEVDDLLNARNPHLGIMPQGIGHRLRRHARETLHDGPGPRHGIFGLPTAVSALLIAFGVFLVIGWIVWVIFYGLLGGTYMLLTVLLAAGAGLLVMVAVFLVFTVAVLLVTAPWRLVRGVRWLWRRAVRA